MHSVIVTKREEMEVAYLRVDAQVRDPEDGIVNGVEDEKFNPKMPFFKNGVWSPTIELETGKIVDWPQGVEAKVHYKVCDAGVYTLLDEEKKPVITIDGYVPIILSPGGRGYGDYIIMDIGPDGVIAKWNVILDEFEDD